MKISKINLLVVVTIIICALILATNAFSFGPTPTYDMTPSEPGELVTVTCWGGNLEVHPLGRDAMRVYCVKALGDAGNE